MPFSLSDKLNNWTTIHCIPRILIYVLDGNVELSVVCLPVRDTHVEAGLQTYVADISMNEPVLDMKLKDNDRPLYSVHNINLQLDLYIARHIRLGD